VVRQHLSCFGSGLGNQLHQQHFLPIRHCELPVYQPSQWDLVLRWRRSLPCGCSERRLPGRRHRLHVRGSSLCLPEPGGEPTLDVHADGSLPDQPTRAGIPLYSSHGVPLR
jgi:hypothetical protein